MASVDGSHPAHRSCEGNIDLRKNLLPRADQAMTRPRQTAVNRSAWQPPARLFTIFMAGDAPHQQCCLGCGNRAKWPDRAVLAAPASGRSGDSDESGG
jgi:hypothetical protein